MDFRKSVLRVQTKRVMSLWFLELLAADCIPTSGWLLYPVFSLVVWYLCVCVCAGASLLSGLHSGTLSLADASWTLVGWTISFFFVVCNASVRGWFECAKHNDLTFQLHLHVVAFLFNLVYSSDPLSCVWMFFASITIKFTTSTFFKRKYFLKENLERISGSPQASCSSPDLDKDAAYDDRIYIGANIYRFCTCFSTKKII